ncbi:cellulose synthase-like protein B4 isoform X3 [Rhododendron vialii]|uniref:cellulose synthase-like protein B4 isoform X3 n=1 Tax=Rhododendron vialii TaxID=182163 RepID=UPI00265F9B16|nr:cellulose synthase-like protein B4 isoform X3 [Rhododendron vialii]
MANPTTSLPLYERVTRKNTIARVIELSILSLLLSLLAYRILSFQDHGFSWLLASLCESWFAFNWVLTVSTKWNQVEYKTHPQRLLQRKPELPPVDMFVTTADPVLEPPILTVNTVLSLLALDYPADKLACYVSDDGSSPLTFYSLVEASKFAKLWVPFCKKYSIQVRAPFRYFSGESMSSQDTSPQFQQDWKKMKDEYEQLSQKIEDAARGSIPCELAGEFADFMNMQRGNHASIVKVIWENKEAGNANGAVPHLVYISREKRPKHPHHFKAGAMNVLYLVRGLAGIQGPFYGGTGCFHRRKVIYGLSPYEYDEEISGKLSDENLHKTFGSSMEFTKSAAQILSGSKSISCGPHDLLSSVEAANQVAACVYEYSTAWGREMGWIYGSTTEDVLTGLIIQGRGWKSTTCMPTPPGFLGCAPSGGPATMTQQKRWATGLVEILVTRRSPLILTLVGELQFRQCLAYLWILLWGLRSVPELCYATLPAYCIISGSRFLPKVEEPALLIPVVIFITYNLYTLSEYFRAGLSARAWWNNQRMLRITAMTAWLFGVFSVILKLLGLSEMVFEVTQKEQSSTNGSDDDNADVGRFTFDESPIFIPATTVLLVNLTALVITILGFRPVARGGNGSGIGEVIFSSCVVLCLWAFLKGLFGKGKYGIPSATVYKSGALALLFVNSSRWTSMG